MKEHQHVYVETSIESAILRTLRYYAIFKYPLTLEELYNNFPISCDIRLIEQSLAELATSQVYSYKQYYTVTPNVRNLVLRRENGNLLAKRYTKDAKKIGSFIFRFPFVKFVGISGSLSKGYADEDTDYDFFIVTEYNRLWICRTILHLFKKLTFLAGQQHKFCMNYFIDSSNLEIEEKNIFTAIELSTLIPVSGHNVYAEMIMNNEWLSQFLPHAYARLTYVPVADKKRWLKKMAEHLLNNCFPEQMNIWLMKRLDARWRRKWFSKHYPEEDYGLAFKTTLHHSKNHPANYQKKILERLNSH